MKASPLPADFWTAGSKWEEEAKLAQFSGFCDYSDGLMGRGKMVTYSGAALDRCACDLPWSHLVDAVGKGDYTLAPREARARVIGGHPETATSALEDSAPKRPQFATHIAAIGKRGAPSARDDT